MYSAPTMAKTKALALRLMVEKKTWPPGLTNVAQAYQGKTILTEQGLDDIVAYLMQSDRVRP